MNRWAEEDDEDWESIELYFIFNITGCEFLEQFAAHQHRDLLNCFLPPANIISQYQYHIDENYPLQYRLDEIHITII